MAGIPPTLPAQPATPSDEWARATTTAALGRADPAPGLHSSTETSSTVPSTDPIGAGGSSISAASQAQSGGLFQPMVQDGAPTVPAGEPVTMDGTVPGAYPATPAGNIPVSADQLRAAASTTAEYVQSAVNAAGQYVPQAVVDAYNSLPSVTSGTTSTMATARASENDHEHKTSLPSREFTGGPGSLPGPMAEAGVAKLPDERAEHEKYTTLAGATAAVAGTVGVLGGAVSNVPTLAAQARDTVVGNPTVQKTADQASAAATAVTGQASKAAGVVKSNVPAVPGLTGSHSTAVTASTVPSREFGGAMPGDHSSGVGALPGDRSEANVAVLPDERNALPTTERSGNEDLLKSERHFVGVGSLVGGRSESGVAVLPDERSTAAKDTAPAVPPKSDASLHTAPTSSQKSADHTSDKKPMTEQAKEKKDEAKDSAKAAVGGHKGEPNKGGGYDTDYHPADLHPLDEKRVDDSKQRAEEEKANGAPAEKDQERNIGDEHAHKEKQRKATFMDKMRGEAKVLLGKVEGKKGAEKVEEGRRLKAGEPPLSQTQPHPA